MSAARQPAPNPETPVITPVLILCRRFGNLEQCEFPRMVDIGRCGVSSVDLREVKLFPPQHLR